MNFYYLIIFILFFADFGRAEIYCKSFSPNLPSFTFRKMDETQSRAQVFWLDSTTQKLINYELTFVRDPWSSTWDSQRNLYRRITSHLPIQLSPDELMFFPQRIEFKNNQTVLVDGVEASVQCTLQNK
jgi:hypothetical protein